MKAFELLTPQVVVAHRDEPLVEAIHKMREKHVGALVVVEEHDGKTLPVGMLTDRDIVVGVFAKDVVHASTLDISDVMTSDVVTASDDEDIDEILRRMRTFDVRRVPIVDGDGTLRGILSLDDIIGAISDELAEAASLVARQREDEQGRRP